MNTYEWCGAGSFAISTCLALIFHGLPTPSVVEPQPPVRSAVAVPRPGWRVSFGKNPAGRDMTYISVGDGPNGGIVLGCDEHRLDAYVESAGQEEFDADKGRDQAVLLRFGEKGFFDQNWNIADSADGIFAPVPAQFVRDLIAEKTVTITYRVNGRVGPHQFEADDLEQRVRESCPAYTYLMKHGLK